MCFFVGEESQVVFTSARVFRREEKEGGEETDRQTDRQRKKVTEDNPTTDQSFLEHQSLETAVLIWLSVQTSRSH